MIEVKNVTKSFEDKTVLHDVSAEFYTGKTNLIIGQSGSGKTVLMKNIKTTRAADRRPNHFRRAGLIANEGK